MRWHLKRHSVASLRSESLTDLQPRTFLTSTIILIPDFHHSRCWTRLSSSKKETSWSLIRAATNIGTMILEGNSWLIRKTRSDLEWNQYRESRWEKRGLQLQPRKYWWPKPSSREESSSFWPSFKLIISMRGSRETSIASSQFKSS